MIYKAYSSVSARLLSLPETGMGYQIIEGQLTHSYTPKRYVVYNSDLVIDLDSDFLANKQLVAIRGYALVSRAANPLNINAESIKLITKSSLFESVNLSQSEISVKSRHSGGRGATDNPREHANGEEFFVRLSAYENDKRIDFINNRLKEGLFTTTLHDYLSCVRTDDDPVDRYALPNDDSIKWSFYIQPKSTDSLQRGIVQPAFGHDGGGIEAYFENGTSDNTYYMTKPYGDLS